MGNKENTHKNIVETAFKMFSDNGFDKTSLSMIAKEVGISKPAIYYYFESKEQLIDYIFDEICKEIEHQNDFSLDRISIDNFEAELISIGYRMIEEHEHDEYFNKIFNEYILLASRNEKYRNRLYEIQKGYLTTYYDLLKFGVEIGAVSAGNIESKANLLGMLIDNIGNFMLTGFQLDYRGIWKEAVTSVLKEDKS
ncbi:TetR family transcriptional regulator [Paenibacillus albidus]|uniref:TetR family transcriptional regulator n=1 Tax=Paenibacillus albidus TaxID=2041023 RepID=A0A917C2N4_9BACL|nr:TetR/AcrR family transcriptional regulator [Paenibacillus albidus]GGF68855.1 TetR family transcriptional regulator [Paenibacillus albidus]